MAAAGLARWVLFDWGGTLMSEEGPLDMPMALWPEVRPIEGAAPMLEALAKRYRLGVATNASISTRGMIESALGRVGLREPFSEVFCYSDIGARKDEDAFWRAVLERLGVEASALAMVGDSLEQDVLAPRRFGIASLWFDPQGRDAPAGIPSVQRLEQVPAAVAALFAAGRAG